LRHGMVAISLRAQDCCSAKEDTWRHHSFIYARLCYSHAISTVTQSNFDSCAVPSRPDPTSQHAAIPSCRQITGTFSLYHTSRATALTSLLSRSSQRIWGSGVAADDGWMGVLVVRIRLFSHRGCGDCGPRGRHVWLVR
jgi:hypothetical protein